MEELKYNIKSLFPKDEILSNIIDRVELTTIQSTNDVFHDLVSCIVEQQIHYRSSKKIFQNKLNQAQIQNVNILNFEDFYFNHLNQLKMSENKKSTLLRTFEYFTINKLNWEIMPEGEIKNRLLSIKGLGNWTIDMILLFTLSKKDIFPYDDFQLKNIMIFEYNLNPKSKLKSQMIEISEQWQNNKSLAVLYLLEWYKLNKSKIPKY